MDLGRTPIGNEAGEGTTGAGDGTSTGLGDDGGPAGGTGAGAEGPGTGVSSVGQPPSIPGADIRRGAIADLREDTHSWDDM